MVSKKRPNFRKVDFGPLGGGLRSVHKKKQILQKKASFWADLTENRDISVSLGGFGRQAKSRI